MTNVKIGFHKLRKKNGITLYTQIIIKKVKKARKKIIQPLLNGTKKSN